MTSNYVYDYADTDDKAMVILNDLQNDRAWAESSTNMEYYPPSEPSIMTPNNVYDQEETDEEGVLILSALSAVKTAEQSPINCDFVTTAEITFTPRTPSPDYIGKPWDYPSVNYLNLPPDDPDDSDSDEDDDCMQWDIFPPDAYYDRLRRQNERRIARDSAYDSDINVDTDITSELPAEEGPNQHSPSYTEQTNWIPNTQATECLVTT